MKSFETIRGQELFYKYDRFDYLQGPSNHVLSPTFLYHIIRAPDGVSKFCLIYQLALACQSSLSKYTLSTTHQYTSLIETLGGSPQNYPSSQPSVAVGMTNLPHPPCPSFLEIANELPKSPQQWSRATQVEPSTILNYVQKLVFKRSIVHQCKIQ